MSSIFSVPTPDPLWVRRGEGGNCRASLTPLHPPTHQVVKNVDEDRKMFEAYYDMPLQAVTGDAMYFSTVKGGNPQSARPAPK